MRTEEKLWYVGTMNDAYFVIDKPPQPAPVDYVCEMDHGVNVIVALGANSKAAELLVAEHNERIGSYPVLECPTCGAPDSFIRELYL